MFDKTKTVKDREKETLDIIQQLDSIMTKTITIDCPGEARSCMLNHGVKSIGRTVSIGTIITIIVNSLSGKELGKLIMDMNDISASRYILVDTKGDK